MDYNRETSKSEQAKIEMVDYIFPARFAPGERQVNFSLAV